MSEEQKKELIDFLKQHLSSQQATNGYSTDLYTNYQGQQATNEYSTDIYTNYRSLLSSYSILLDKLKELASE